MIVVSLFDGMSCGQIALTELGVHIDKYYASEVDTHAIKQTQLNFPNTVQLGDVTKWREWDIDWNKVDLILAGSPCQGFSFAGKQLAFDDPRSKLFFEFALILNHAKKHNPDIKFLLENVDMKREYMRIISEYVGIFPVNINSNLVSAQNRSRWYWSNIRTNVRGLFDEVYTDIPQPKDKGILLRDILEIEVNEKYYISMSVVERINRKEYSKPKFNPNKTGAINTRNNSGQMGLDSGTTFISIDGKAPNQRASTGRSLDKKHNYQIINIDGFPKTNLDKASCFTAGAHSGGNHSDMDLICVAMRGRENGQEIEPNTTGKTNCITSVSKDNLIMQINPSTESGGKQPYQQNRIYDENGIMPAVMTANRGYVLTNNYVQLNDNGFDSDNRFFYENGKHGSVLTKGEVKTGVCTESKIRRLTPTECARLQTIPAWYKWACSDTQQYRMLGNGWTVSVISHIFSYLPKE